MPAIFPVSGIYTMHEAPSNIDSGNRNLAKVRLVRYTKLLQDLKDPAIGILHF